MHKFLVLISVLYATNFLADNPCYAWKMMPNPNVLRPANATGYHLDEATINSAYDKANAELNNFDKLTKQNDKVQSVIANLTHGKKPYQGANSQQLFETIHRYEKNWSEFIKAKHEFEQVNNQLKTIFLDFIKNFQAFEQEHSLSSSSRGIMLEQKANNLSWQDCLDIINKKMQIHKKFFISARLNNPKLLDDFKELESRVKNLLSVNVEKLLKLEEKLQVLTSGQKLGNNMISPLNHDADYIINFMP